MKIRFALLAAALVASQAFASQPTDLRNEPALSKARLSGALQLRAETNYAARGYVISHSVAEGDGILGAAMKLNYDIGREGLWTLESTISYAGPTSGHNLYGNPTLYVPAGNGQVVQTKLGEKNIENEFALITAAKYTREKWNMTMGHEFIHGGLVGVMAKHFRGQGASNTNEVFITPEWTPAKWISMGVTTRYSFQGIQGWWFEPYITLKAPIIGTPEDIKVAGVLTFGMAATADYFNYGDFACANGVQGYWIKFSTPWFAKDNLIITPSVLFNWAGEGAMEANEIGHVKKLSRNVNNVPFREFAVVGGLSITYTF